MQPGEFCEPVEKLLASEKSATCLGVLDSQPSLTSCTAVWTLLALEAGRWGWAGGGHVARGPLPMHPILSVTWVASLPPAVHPARGAGAGSAVTTVRHGGFWEGADVSRETRGVWAGEWV